AREIVLVDFKLEFGRHHGELLVADAICPDTCRLWDKATGRKLDKDRFRRDLGAVEEAYQEAARRICGIAARWQGSWPPPPSRRTAASSIPRARPCSSPCMRWDSPKWPRCESASTSSSGCATSTRR